MMQEHNNSNGSNINFEEEKQDEEEEDNRENEINRKINKRIGCCRRFCYRFRLPNIFELIFVGFTLLLWIQIILKLAFNSQFDQIIYTKGQKLELGNLELFQYIINYVDYFLLLAISFLFMYFINNLIQPVNFLIHHLMNYMKKYILSAFALIMITCLLGAIGMTVVYGMFVYGYSNFFQSLVAYFTLLLRGSLMYPHIYFNYTEGYKWLIDRIGLITLFVFIIFVHFFVRYFVINASVASLFSEYKLLKLKIAKTKI